MDNLGIMLIDSQSRNKISKAPKLPPIVKRTLNQLIAEKRKVNSCV
jgi:hypothetical protein